MGDGCSDFSSSRFYVSLRAMASCERLIKRNDLRERERERERNEYSLSLEVRYVRYVLAEGAEISCCSGCLKPEELAFPPKCQKQQPRLFSTVHQYLFDSTANSHQQILCFGCWIRNCLFSPKMTFLIKPKIISSPARCVGQCLSFMLL